MRVSFVLPDANLGGGTRAIAMIAEHLRRRGHDVLVVSTPVRPPADLRGKLYSLVRGNGWPSGTAVRPSHLDGTAVPRRVLRRWRPVDDRDLPDADVVIATWWETAEWVDALSPSKGTKLHYMMDYEVWGGPLERVDATCRLPMPKIVIAEWVATLLEERFGVTNYTVIPCAVDVELFHAPPRGKQPRPTVGLCYTTFWNKGCDISLKAVEIARRKLPDLQLVAFGNGTPGPDLPLPDDCEFSCKVPNERLRSVYARCDAWLFGTRIEGYGLPILEAMACRTPVIGTPAGAAPELIGQGGGYLVRPEDPEDMAAAIERLVSLPDPEWRALSDVAHATAMQHRWDDVADRFEAALVRAVEQSKVAVS